MGARTAFLVPKAATEPARVAALRWSGSLTAGGASRLVDGVNRNRGRIPGCGGVGGDRPTQRIDPRRTCTDASELVVLTPSFGARTRTAPGGYEAVVRDGVVLVLSARDVRTRSLLQLTRSLPLCLKTESGDVRASTVEFLLISPKLVDRCLPAEVYEEMPRKLQRGFTWLGYEVIGLHGALST